MKDKASKTVDTSKVWFTNFLDILTAAALTGTLLFSAYTGWQKWHEGYEWKALLVASTWLLYVALAAWAKVLNKK